MKLQVIILLSFFFGFSQVEKVEVYHDNFGRTLTLYSDSTFVYTYVFDMSGSWTKGKWKKKKNIITFIVIPIYDTIRITGYKDSLRLSCNEKPNLISARSRQYIRFPKCNGHQSLDIFEKLYYKKKRIFQFDNKGKLVTKKRKRMWRGNELHDPWFTKSE